MRRRNVLFATSFRCAAILCAWTFTSDARAQPIVMKRPEAPSETAVTCRPASFKAREALQLADSGEMPEGREFVVVAPAFHNGEIRIDVAGEVLPNAPQGSRGFVGIAFRMNPQRDAYEVMYLRPANGRVEDQLKGTRPSSSQELTARSHPAFPAAW